MNKNGFTLIEVLTTLVIISMGTLAIHQAFGRSIQAVKHSEEALLVSHLVPEPLVLAQLDSWQVENASAPVRSQSAFENYPGFSFEIESTLESMNDLDFIRCDVELKTPSGSSVKSAWLMPERRKQDSS